MLRLDRLATLYFFYPISRIRRAHKDGRIPILMYHSISNESESGVHPYYMTNTSPEVFAMHMKYLYENNYKIISLSAAVNLLRSEPVNNSINKLTRFVVITFDDGFLDFYTQAFPILQKYSFTATVFLPTGFIDNNGSMLNEKEHLSWDAVRELNNNSIDFGSHTVTHPHLKSIKREEIEIEIRQSKYTIEDKLGKPIDSFSYPFAFPEGDREFRKYLKGILQKWGYKYGVSTRIGTTSKKDDICFAKRIPVNSCDNITFFKAKLEGAYDWPFNLQYFSKVISNI